MKTSKIAKILHATLEGQDQEYSGVSIDSRSLKPGNVYIALKGEQFDGHDFVEAAAAAGAAAAIVSKPGNYSLPIILVNDTHQALMDWATVYRQQFNIPVIAITGSCGKTTTRAITDSILSLVGPTLASQGSFNNNIGVPLTILQLTPQHQFLVQEVGANHPGEIAELMKILKPTISVVTCVAPVHLEGFGSIEGVAAAKGEIYEGLGPEGVAIVNADQPYYAFQSDFWKTRKDPSFHPKDFGQRGPAHIEAQNIHLDQSARARFELCMGSEKTEVQLQLIGEHNVTNALAAAAIAEACHVPLTVIKEGLENAKAEKMRLQAKSGIKSSQIIDDSYNANPIAMLAALKVLSHHAEPRVFVVGDMRELGPDAERYHSELGQQAKEHNVHSLYCYGPLSKSAAESFGENAHWFENIAELINNLQECLQPGSTILVKGSRSMGMDRVVKALVL